MSNASLNRGWVVLDREVWTHPAFEASPMSEREAWIWLVSHAEYRTDADVPRGCLVTSYQDLANAWQWRTRQVARHYLERLAKQGMVVLMRGCIRITNYDRHQLQIPQQSAPTHNVRTNPAQQSAKNTDTYEAPAHNVRTENAQNGPFPPTPPLPEKQKTKNHSGPPPLPPAPVEPSPEGEGHSPETILPEPAECPSPAAVTVPAALVARQPRWMAGVLELEFRVDPGELQRAELKACGLRYDLGYRCWIGTAQRMDLPRLQRLVPGIDLSMERVGPTSLPTAPTSVQGAVERRPSVPGPDGWMQVRASMRAAMGEAPVWLACLAAVETPMGFDLVTDDEAVSILWPRTLRDWVEQLAERELGRPVSLPVIFDRERHASLVAARTGVAHE